MDRKLAFSAVAVHGDALGRVAEPLLRYAQWRFGPGLTERYAERCRQLEEQQRRFDLHPCAETLGAPDLAVDRDAYRISLLLSIVFTNHRFEILQQQFLKGLGRHGRLVGLGIGTGYEIELAAEILPGWEIAGYDIDPAAEEEACNMLRYLGFSGKFTSAGNFPSILRTRPGCGSTPRL
jgi:hypothetical protein